MPVKVKVSGAWKDAVPKVKVSGAWKDVSQKWVKVAGAWKELLANAPWNLAPYSGNTSGVLYTGNSYDFSSLLGASGSNSIMGMAFSSTGTRLYTLIYRGSTSRNIQEHRLSTAWDITTASFDSPNAVEFELYYGDSDVTFSDLTFSIDGTKMYVSESGVGGIENVRQYSLSTGYDLTTASYEKTKALTEGSPTVLEFSEDGSRLYVITSGRDVIGHQYDLSTPWDVATLSYNSPQDYDYGAAGDITSLASIAFKPDDERVYWVFDSAIETIFQYKMSPGSYLSSTYSGVNYSVGFESTSCRAISVRPSGLDFYMLEGTGTVAVVYQYTIPED